MNLTCRQVTELLYEYLEGEMPSEQCQCLEQHLCNCPPCHVFLTTYRETIRITRSLPCEALPDELVARLTGFLEKQSGTA